MTEIKEQIAEILMPPGSTVASAWQIALSDQILSLKVGNFTLGELADLAEKGKVAGVADDEKIEFDNWQKNLKQSGYTKDQIGWL